jgi:translation initiation factor IF-3
LLIAKALRTNEQIRVSPVRLIDQDNNQVGIVSTADAMRMARDAGVDLVEVSPMERPPVCRVMDYGRYKYHLKKKQKDRPSHDIVLKELRLRPKTDQHDREVKLGKARRFLQDGNKVQFTMLFRGRERAHPDVGLHVFQSIVDQLGEEIKVERPPRMEGRRMTMVLCPAKH